MEHGAVVDTLAFEHTARIMEPMVEHVELGVAPRDEAAIVPDEAVTIVEREYGHRIFLAPSRGSPGAAVARPRCVGWNFISRRTPYKGQRLRDMSTCLT
jgi:hypothetical protein